VKKGRHRRFEEARALKQLSTEEEELRPARASEPSEPCAECGASSGSAHASWCRAMEDEADDQEEEAW